MNGNGWGRLKLRVSAIVWFVLALGFLLSLPVLFGVSWLVVLALAVLAALIALPAAWLVRRIFAGQRQQKRATSYAKAFLALLFGGAILLASPIYALALVTDLKPITVPTATLTNGSKTVVFQGMMHIGSEQFYKSVVYDLEQALADGYVLYYEGVRGSPDGDKWFSDTLAGGGDLSLNYEEIGNICGLVFQLSYFGLLQKDMALHPERHVAADVTTADMMHEYERLMQSDPAFAAANAKAAAADKTNDDGLVGLLKLVAQATPGQRELLGIACRGYLTLSLGRDAAPAPLDPVILDFRNRELAKRIEADAHDKIYMTYGAGHLPGLLAQLQAADPAWQIKSLKWSRPIIAPEQLEGKIQ